MSTGQNSSETKELIKTFYSILIKLNVSLNCHAWFVATILGIVFLETKEDNKKQNNYT